MANADTNIFLWLNGWVGQFPLFDRVIEALVSDYLVPVGLALTLLGLWFAGVDRPARQRRQIGMMAALTSMALSSFVVMIVNGFYFRPRPFVDHEVTLLFYQPTDSSFPSNPIAATFAIAFALWRIDRRAGWVAVPATAMYGLSRVYAGVHYPLDILAGVLIAFVVTWLVFKLKDFMEPVLVLVIKAFRILCVA